MYGIKEGIYCSSCGQTKACTYVQALEGWTCADCLLAKVADSSGEFVVVHKSTLDGAIECANCSELVATGAVCKDCAECDSCSNLAISCEDHRNNECENCSEPARYCYSCTECEESHGNYCWDCGNEADFVYCDRHTPKVCDECGNVDRDDRVLCEADAREEWLTGTVPLAVIGEDGVITSDGLEVQWN